MNLIKYNFFALIVIVSLIAMSSSCKKDPEPVPKTTGKLHIEMDFYNDGNPMLWDTLAYTNAAGNVYTAWYARFFITRVTIYKGKNATVLNSWKNEHYFDSDIPSTLDWKVVDDIEMGNYDSLSFTFGFNDDDNESFMFVNPPENLMVWPEPDGGGYHYMQIDGKWINPQDTLRSFNFHLGNGNVYDAGGNVLETVDNSFRVSLTNSDFSISADKTTKVKLRMHIDNWFESPIVWNHDIIGGDIMQKQDEMAKVVKNGWNVFTFEK